MAQVYTFTDSNGEVRLMAEIHPAPGGAQPSLQLLGPFVVLESDTENVLWTPAIGDVIVDIWLEVVTTFDNRSVNIEVYTDARDFFFAGQTNPLVADTASQDASRRWPRVDWIASRITSPAFSVPTTMLTAAPVLADVLGHGPGAGVANIYALTATPA